MSDRVRIVDSVQLFLWMTRQQKWFPFSSAIVQVCWILFVNLVTRRTILASVISQCCRVKEDATRGMCHCIQLCGTLS